MGLGFGMKIKNWDDCGYWNLEWRIWMTLRRWGWGLGNGHGKSIWSKSDLHQ